MQDLDLESIFSYHPGKGDAQGKLHQEVRDRCRWVAEYLQANLPASAERTLAIRALQTAMMYGNSAVAQYYELSE